MRVQRRKATRREGRSGAAAVEMALILPLLITIVLGCVDFGRFAYMYISVANAARAGAAVGSFNPVTPSTQTVWEGKIRDAINDEMSAQTGFDVAALTPAPTITTSVDGSLKRVRVVVNYRFRTIVQWPLLPTQVTLSRAVEMRVIR